MTRDEAYVKFQETVRGKAKEIDPEDELDWFSLTLGFFLALGFSPDESHEMSVYARYDCQYWGVDE